MFNVNNIICTLMNINKKTPTLALEIHFLSNKSIVIK